MQNADDFIQKMKQETDAIVADDEDIQKWLFKVMSIAKSVPFAAEAAPIRAFYFALFMNFDFELCLAFEFDLSIIFGIKSVIQTALDLTSDLNSALRLARMIDPGLARNLELAIELDKVLNPTNSPTLTRELAKVLESVRAIVIADFDIESQRGMALESGHNLADELAFNPPLNLAIEFLITNLREIILTLEPERDINKLNPDVTLSLKKIKDKLSKRNENEEKFESWWEAEGEAWTEELKNAIGSDFLEPNSMFDEQQQELLKQYYDANKLLMNGLNSNCAVSDEVRDEMEETLLLPIEEIKKRQQQM